MESSGKRPFGLGRRQFLAMGGAGAATILVSATASAAITNTTTADARSLPPVGLDPATGRATASSPFTGPVYKLALAAGDGFVSMPEGTANIDPYFPDTLGDPAGRTTYTFGFRNVTLLDQAQVLAQKFHTQISAPLFGVPAGSELWVGLTNLGLQIRPDLVDSHTLHWHGFRNAVPFYDGVPETSISVPIGREFTYVFRPKDAGTYMYHCHFEDVEHVTMGMTGIVYVTPAEASPTNKVAYGAHDGVGSTNDPAYDREYAIILTEIDSRAHWNDAHIQTTDWTDFHPEFWLMNGRAYPDTLEPNGTRLATGELAHAGDADHRLASQPHSSLIECAPGERVLLRMANLGFQNHTLCLPGLAMEVVGRDARYVHPAARRTSDTVQLGPGESHDIIITAPPADGVYPLYNRDLSRFTGSADHSDQWIGGQRTEIRVTSGITAQLKPNGAPGEAPWTGELPVKVSG
jgi:FtsP/CotA-like multicopper oxidase with cupredoxin domain